MGLKSALLRASRGFRDDLGLHLTAASSLAVGFLCLGGALVATTNLTRVAERWEQSRRVTFYLKADPSSQLVEQLRASLEALPEVDRVAHVTTEQARSDFGQQFQLGKELESLSADAFPAYLDVKLRGTHAAARAKQLAQRLGDLSIVSEIETYDSWFGELAALLSASRTIVLGVALAVLICVLAVVRNTIRLVLSGRRQEIEVLKLCGATDRFVRRPFVLEGALQGGASALIAVIVLSLGLLLVRPHLDATLGALAGVSLAFEPLLALALVFAGALTGAGGSLLALRKYLAV